MRLFNRLIQQKNIDRLFDGDDSLFKAAIKDSQIYFEWGCGDSTLWVARNTDAEIWGVDTSQHWVSTVSQNICRPAHLYHIDVGPVSDWGRPTTYRYRHNFINYVTANLKAPGADVLLIDGRFRVAAFFSALRTAKVGAKIIFDDYTDREHYHIVEEYIKPSLKLGRQAIFEVIPLKKEDDIKIRKLMLDFTMVFD